MCVCDFVRAEGKHHNQIILSNTSTRMLISKYIIIRSFSQKIRSFSQTQSDHQIILSNPYTYPLLLTLYTYLLLLVRISWGHRRSLWCVCVCVCVCVSQNTLSTNQNLLSTSKNSVRVRSFYYHSTSMMSE